MTAGVSEMGRMGIALGSGGARGLAHIGILEELASLGIEPDLVSGTSMGSFIGAGYCGGHLEKMRKLALEIDIRTLLFRFIDFGLPHSGLIEGKRVNALLEELMPEATFEGLDKPFRCVATDLKSGEEVVFSKGRVQPAVRASISIPGLFTPVSHEGRFLVDGGLVNPVPVDQLKDMGASWTLAVDVNQGCLARGAGKRVKKEERKGAMGEWLDRVEAKLKGGESTHLEKVRKWFKTDSMPNLIDVMGDTVHIIENQVSKIRLKMDPPDVLLAPEVGDIEILDFHHAEEIMEAGRRCVRAQREDLERFR